MELDRPSNYDGLAYGMLIAGHFHEGDTYSTVRPDGMSDWLITFTLDGEGSFEIDGSERRVRAGDITLLKPGTPHRYGTPKGKSWHFVWAQSIVEALNRMRIKQAALLLAHTNRNATEAAHDVGFQNYNHFTRQFRKYIGMTPSEFSQSVRTKEK